MAAIFAFGVVLRVWGLATRSIWYDESWMIAFGNKLGFNSNFVDIGLSSDPPMMPLFVRILHEILERAPVAAPGSYLYDVLLRSIACGFSILAVFLCYRLVLLAFSDRQVALLSAFLCAISPFQIYYAQEIKPYSLLLVISLASFIFLLKALRWNRPFDWLALAFFLGIGMYAHLFAVWNIVLANVYFVVGIRRRWRQIPQWAAAQAVIAAISLPMVLFAYQWAHIYDSITIKWSFMPDWKSGLLTFKTFFAGYGATTWMYRPLFLICLVLCVYGLYRMRHNRDRLLLAAVFGILPIAANIIIWRQRQFALYEHRTFIMSSIFIYGIVSTGLAGLPGKGSRYIAFILIGALSAVGLYDYYAQRLHPLQTHRMGVRYKVENRQAAAYVAANFAPGDVVAHASHFTYFPFKYYLPAARQHDVRLTDGELIGFLQATPNEHVWDTYGALPIMAEDAVRGARRVWLVKSWWEPWETPPQTQAIMDWFDSRFTKKEERQYDGILIRLYEQPEGAQ